MVQRKRNLAKYGLHDAEQGSSIGLGHWYAALSYHPFGYHAYYEYCAA